MRLNLIPMKGRERWPRTLLFCSLMTCGTTMFAIDASPNRNVEGNNAVFTVESTLQQKKVTGRVVDNNGEPIIGANVLVKRSSQGSITDLNGHFSVEARKGDVLQISYIGYISQEITIKDDAPLQIRLNEDAQTLNEVVVVGYGTQKKANLTGSVASVKMDEALGDRPISSTAQALQGTAPGLQIITDTGRPGQSSSLNIRGYTSINGGGPLILVDNAEVESIDDINPRDIESVSVLKDASASAIYGARGAFGVILITTKQGKKNEKMKVSYNANFAFTTATNLPKKLNTYDTAKTFQEWEVRNNGIIADIDKWVELLEQYRLDPNQFPEDGVYVDENGNRYPLKDSYDYWDMAFTSGFEQIHNVTLTGGGERVGYRVSLGYTNQDGILTTNKDSYKRYNLNTNLNMDITSNLKASVNIYYKNDKRLTPGGMWKVFSNGVLNPPYSFKGTKPDPTTGEEVPYWTPETFLNTERPQENRGDQFRIFGRLEWKPVKGLTLAGEYTVDKSNKYIDNTAIINRYWSQSGTEIEEYNTVSSYQRNNQNRFYQSFSATARYELSKKGHNLSVLAGVNYEDADYKQFSGKREDLISESVPSFGTATGDMTVDDSYYEWAVAGLFGRVNYDFQEKYLLEFSARYDGSSRFAPGDRFVFVPSGSVGWHISKEKFMESLAPTLSSLKLFASYGEIGNQNTGSNYYPYLPTMATYNAEWIDPTTNLTYLTIGTPAIVSAGFTWEKVRTLNVGVDFALFNSRLSGTFEWYNRRTLGMLDAATELPAVLGTEAPLQNVTDLETKGWELNIQWKDQIGKVRYSIGGNLFDSRAYITKVKISSGNIGNYYVGKELGEIWGYEVVGFYDIDDFEEGVAGSYSDKFTLKKDVPGYKNTSVIPGDIKFADLDGNGVVDWGTNSINDHGDKKVIGNSRPRLQFGINGSVEYKNFDLSFFLQGVGKRDRYINTYLSRPYHSTFTYAIHEGQTDVWSVNNQDAYFPRVMSPNYNVYNQQHTRSVYNGAYLNIKNITLGYNLPQQWMKRIGLTQARLYVSGENLFIFDHLPDGIQTELYDESSGAGYPTLRKFSFGIDVTF